MWSLQSLIINNDENQRIFQSIQPITPYPSFLIEETSLLNKMQMAICILRYNNVSFRNIAKLFGISSHNTIGVAIKRTAMSILWIPHHEGGSTSIISPVLINRLKNQITWRRKGLNCMKTIEAKSFILDELSDFKKRAIQRLYDWNDASYINEVQVIFDNFILTDDIFSDICAKTNIFIMKGINLELLRRKCCNQIVIDKYFDDMQTILQDIDNPYVYNADETGLASKKVYQILTDNKQYNITTSDITQQHISAMLCYSASGDKMPPFYIFPKRESSFVELEDITGIYLATSKTGWMTTYLWDTWCTLFVSHITIRRESNQLNRTKAVILIVDGHLSRMSPFGVRLLYKFNIKCFILPAHCTHVLQPFDVSVASSLKARYLQQLLAKLVKYMASSDDSYTPAQKVRRQRILAFLNAWNQCEVTLLMQSFVNAGLCPVDKTKLSMQNLVTDPTTLPDTQRPVKTLPISGKCATDNLQLFEPYTYRRFVNNRVTTVEIKPEDITAEMIASIWFGGNSETGKVFNDVPIILCNGNNIMNGFSKSFRF